MIAIIKHWKLIASVALIAGAFLGGWQTASWRADAKLKSAHEAANTALVEAIRRERVKSAVKVEAERVRALALSRTIEALRASHTALQEDIANARLESRAAADLGEDGTYTCPAPLGDDDFIRLWNEAARDRD